jgi:hypothetical protein
MALTFPVLSGVDLLSFGDPNSFLLLSKEGCCVQVANGLAKVIGILSNAMC